MGFSKMVMDSGLFKCQNQNWYLYFNTTLHPKSPLKICGVWAKSSQICQNLWEFCSNSHRFIKMPGEEIGSAKSEKSSSAFFWCILEFWIYLLLMQVQGKGLLMKFLYESFVKECIYSRTAKDASKTKSLTYSMVNLFCFIKFICYNYCLHHHLIDWIIFQPMWAGNYFLLFLLKYVRLSDEQCRAGL